jgi:hypothetical protein
MKRLTQIVLTIILLLGLVGTGWAAGPWYANAAVAPGGAGTSGDPWGTLAEVNAGVGAGETVYLTTDATHIFRGQIVPAVASVTYIGSGSTGKAIISAGEEVRGVSGDWGKEGTANVWRKAIGGVMALKPAQVLFDGTLTSHSSWTYGVKTTSIATVGSGAKYSWWVDDNYLYVYSPTGPDTNPVDYYSAIEADQRTNCVAGATGINNLTFTNISCRQGRGAGATGGGADADVWDFSAQTGIVLNNCEGWWALTNSASQSLTIHSTSTITVNGGRWMNSQCCIGHGAQANNNCTVNYAEMGSTVSGSYVNNFYNSGGTNPSTNILNGCWMHDCKSTGFGALADGCSLTLNSCIISGSAGAGTYAFYRNVASAGPLAIYNTVFNQLGSTYIMVTSSATGTSTTVKNCVFLSSTNNRLFIDLNLAGGATFTSDYNSFYNSTNSTSLSFKWAGTNIALNNIHTAITGWTAVSGQDGNSIITNPAFINGSGAYTAKTDFAVLSTSPLFNAGTKIAGLLADAEGKAREQGGRTDIGAYEYNSSASWLGF